LKDDGILIESLDACFGLTRRKGRGDISIASRHGTLLFSDQDDVDNFVDNYEHTKAKSLPQVMGDNFICKIQYSWW
jgi:uncharacterized NAD(P)/FAD-binding protein YdhS